MVVPLDYILLLMYMIPLTFHFAYFRGTTNWKWLDIHTLCIKSCLINAKAERIVIHLDRSGEGPAWDALNKLDKMELIELRTVIPDVNINGFPVTDQRLWTDVYRLRTLEQEGGFFCDLDFIFLRSFQNLRDGPAVIGTQCKQKKKLCCALMGCEPGSDFIRAYLKRYETWNPNDEKVFWIFANNVPWELAQTQPVNVLARSVFFPLAWSNKKFWDGKPICMKTAVAIHLWGHLHPEITREILDKTCLKPVLELLDQGGISSVVTSRPGGLLTFD